MRTLQLFTLYTCAIIIAQLSIFAVETHCQGCSPQPNPNIGNFSLPAPYSVDPDCILDFPVVLNIVRNAAGNNGISEQQALDAFEYLKTKFQSANITFRLLNPATPVTYVDNDFYSPMRYDRRYNLSQFAHTSGAINIWFVTRDASDPISWVGFTNWSPDYDLYIENSNILNSHIVHEMGHCLGLWHTHGGFDKQGNRTPQEYVNGTNCATAGDLVCDTQAEPDNNDRGILDSVNTNCQYIGSQRDTNGDLYRPNIDNYMAYSPHHCRTRFTAGQIVRMRQEMISNPLNLSGFNQLVQFSNRINGVIIGEGIIDVSLASVIVASVPSGASIELTPCIEYGEKTREERLPLASHTEKHHDWNEKNFDYLLSNTFTPDAQIPSSLTQRANFSSMNPATISNDFERTAYDGNVKFKDPWYLETGGVQNNTFLPFSSPHHPTGAYNKNVGGIFPGQHVDLLLPNKPFYSAQVPSYVDKNTKQSKPLPLSDGDWVNTGIFSSNLSLAEVKDDPQHHNYSINQSQWTRNPDFTKAIEFIQQGAEIFADYKAHMYSTGPQYPTKRNSQRKVAYLSSVFGQNASHHVVYESNNRVYYTSTNDNGATWSPEELVSAYYGAAGKPCIAISDHKANFDDEGYIYITFIENNQLVVKARPQYYLNQNPGEWYEVDRIVLTTASNSNPVIAASTIQQFQLSSVAVVVWEEGNYLRYSIYDELQPLTALDTRSGQTITFRSQPFREGRKLWNQQVIPPQFPSIYYDNNVSSLLRFAVAWNEKGIIYYDDFAVKISGTARVENYNPAEFIPLVPGRDINWYVGPSISGSYPIVAYQYSDNWTNWPTTLNVNGPLQIGSHTFSKVTAPYGAGSGSTGMGQNNVAVHLRSGGLGYNGNWNTSTIVLSANSIQGVGAPCVAVKGFSNQSVGFSGARVAVNQGVGGVAVARVDGLPRTVTTIGQADGYDPNMNPTGNLLEVYSENLASAPSPLLYKISSTQQALNKTTSTHLVHMKELLVTNEDSAFTAFGICRPHVLNSLDQGTLLEWTSVEDTIATGEEATIEEKIRTTAFTVPVGGKVEFATELFARNINRFGTQFSYNLKIVDATSGQVLLTDPFPITELPSDSGMYLLYRLTLTSIEGQTVYMTLGVSQSDSTRRMEILDRYSLDVTFEKSAPAMTSPKELPRTIVLDQNHPNPFGAGSRSKNHSTTLNFSLPVESSVRFSVVDNLGREVKTLANGNRPAGWYSYQFNASTLPSGVYYYRLIANGQTLTRKMTIRK